MPYLIRRTLFPRTSGSRFDTLARMHQLCVKPEQHSWHLIIQAGGLGGVEHNGEHYPQKLADLEVGLLA